MSTYILQNELKKLTDLGIDIAVYIRTETDTDTPFKSEVIEKLLAEIPQKIEADGFFLAKGGETRFSIVLSMPARSDVAIVHLTGGKDKKLSRLTNFSETDYWTAKNVSTFYSADGYTTKPPDNGFKVVSTAGNVLRVFEVAIATRIYEKEGCLHFLIVQEVYTGQLYYDEQLKAIMVPREEYPGYENWPSLRQLVTELTDASQLPREVIPNPKDIPPVSKPNRGRMIYFNASTGLGMAKIAGNQVAGVHWKELNIDVPFPYVESGEEIEFEFSHTVKDHKRLVKVTPL